nr:glycosyltransferase family 4 protein [Desulfobacula sp.]
MKKKICRITDNFPPPWTGVSPAAYELSAAQSRQGVDVHVITKCCKGSGETDAEAPFSIYRVHGRLIFFEIMAFVKLICLHHKYKFDAIHSHGSSFFFFHLLRKIFPKVGVFKIPVVVSIHNIRDYQDQTYKKADFFLLAESILGRRLDDLREKKNKMLRTHNWQKVKQKVSYTDADCLVTVSKALENALISRYRIPQKKIKTIYNGVSTRLLAKGKETAEQKREPSAKTLLFVGRTIGTKNEAALLKAMPIILEKYPETRLVIIGNGYWQKTLKEISFKLCIKDRVSFINYVEHKKIFEYYMSSDVFVFPSFSEGLPKVLIEAMAAGLPVVASNVDGNNELVMEGKTGFLVAPNDFQTFAEKIMLILGDREKAVKLGRTAQLSISQKLTWDSVARSCNDFVFNNTGWL